MTMLVHMDFLDKRNKNIDVAFEEVLELKLVEALLKESGRGDIQFSRTPDAFADRQRLEALMKESGQ